MADIETPIIDYGLDAWDSLEDEIKKFSNGDLRKYKNVKPKLDAIIRERNAACPDPGPDNS